MEAGIPEDDPRNPGVIADNVGDNVGDVAGMGSDIFESYCGAMIASIAIAATLSDSYLGAQNNLMFLPLALSSAGIVCSLLGIILVRIFCSKSAEAALRIGTIGASLIFMGASGVVVAFVGVDLAVWHCVVVGALGGVVIGLVTEYYTSGAPIRKIAKGGETGAATVMINGLSIGMQSVVAPLVVLANIVMLASSLAGLYGVGIAAVGMLATVGMTMAIDAYGPVADNAGWYRRNGRFG